MSYKRILVPVDGSSTSKAGLKEALKLARARNVKLCLLNIMDEHVIFSSPEAAPNIQIILDSQRRRQTSPEERGANRARQGRQGADRAGGESRHARRGHHRPAGEALAGGHHRDGNAWAPRRESPDHGQRRRARRPQCQDSSAARPRTRAGEAQDRKEKKEVAPASVLIAPA